eukprot:m.1248047 g.1248047  ORF g.1248047 m.1248047 type:complete len:266 (-) comp24696_c0_seq1:1365-2162(-)
MCWNLEVSAVAGVYGYLVSYYLYQRNYSQRDPWYALFLATFTTTQVFDAYFWWLAGESGDLPCTPANEFVSKYILPVAIFFQPWVLTLFPSDSAEGLRWPYRLVTVLITGVPIIASKCTSLYTTTGLWHGQTLMYGGVMPSYLVMNCGILFWAAGALLFVKPFWVCLNILLIGGLNLIIMLVVDGTIRLVSKLCFYCLLLSFVWILEPYLRPPATLVVIVSQSDDDVPLCKDALSSIPNSTQQDKSNELYRQQCAAVNAMVLETH